MNPEPTEGLERFRQYREIIPDYDRFEEVLRGKRPEALRTNRWAIDSETLNNRLTGAGYSLRKDRTFFNLLRWSDERPASATIPHWTGKYYLQDPASLLPVEALGVGRGSVVLDMCAAPGGKALHLTERVEESGLVVANEPVPNRRITLETNLRRMGAPNMVISGYDGQSVPESIWFDAVLVDAPCSGEGTARKDDRPPTRESEERLGCLAETQYRLLEKACRVVRPGGVVIYSTCSFAPEENEAIVARVLANTEAVLEEIPFDAPHEPGVTSWKGKGFPGDVRKMWRCYPRHLDGGGMTVARLRKPGTTSPGGRSLTGTDRVRLTNHGRGERFVRYMENRFGVDPGLWTAGRFEFRSGSVFWGPRSLWDSDSWKWEATGWRVGRVTRGGFKPTTRCLQRLGPALRRGKVRCGKEGLAELLNQRETPRVTVEPNLPRGYVALAGPAGWILGCGFWTGAKLRSQFPKGLTRHFPKQELNR